jgi:glycosyltransferase involved in cell wall biosynthesis
MDFVFIAVGITSPKGYSFKPVIEISRAIVSSGHRLIILTSKAGETAFKNVGFKADFWIIDRREEMPTTNWLLVSLEMVIRMFKAGLLLRRKSFHGQAVVFACSNMLWEVFPLLFVKRKSAIRVSSLHMTFPSPFKGFKGAFTNRLKFPSLRETLAFVQQWLSLICMKHASDLVFAQSNIWHYLVDKGIPQERIVPFTPGIELDFIASVPPSAEEYDACWIGRYHPMKGCEDMIRVWGMVCQTRKEARLAIMGNVVLDLRPLIKQMHLEENVELLGSVDNETKFKVMKGSKLFLFPSYYESWGHVVLEAMACGLPVIAYDLPVYKDIFTRGMVKVPIGDENALAQQVMWLLGNEEARNRVSATTQKTVSEYKQGWEESVDRLLLQVKQIGGD